MIVKIQSSNSHAPDQCRRRRLPGRWSAEAVGAVKKYWTRNRMVIHPGRPPPPPTVSTLRSSWMTEKRLWCRSRCCADVSVQPPPLISSSASSKRSRRNEGFSFTESALDKLCLRSRPRRKRSAYPSSFPPLPLLKGVHSSLSRPMQSLRSKTVSTPPARKPRLVTRFCLS